MAIIRKCLGNNQAIIDEAYKHHQVGGHGIGSIPHDAFCDGWAAGFKEYLLTRPSPWIKITPEMKIEAMPEIRKSYFISYYNEHDVRMVGLAFFNSDRHWAIGNEYVNPTHYMPIPPIPEKGARK